MISQADRLAAESLALELDEAQFREQKEIERWLEQRISHAPDPCLACSTATPTGDRNERAANKLGRTTHAGVREIQLSGAPDLTSQAPRDASLASNDEDHARDNFRDEPKHGHGGPN